MCLHRAEQPHRRRGCRQADRRPAVWSARVTSSPVSSPPRGPATSSPGSTARSPSSDAPGYDFKEVGTSATQAQELPLLEQWYLGNKDVKAFYCVDSGDSIAAATIIASTTSGARSVVLVGTSASPSSSRCKRELCSSRSTSRRTCKASCPTIQLFLYNISAGSDEALQHRHRPRLRDSAPPRSLPAPRQPLRRQQQGSDRLRSRLPRSF